MAGPRTHRQKEIRRHLWIYGLITPYIIIAVFPIYWMVITAFKQNPDLYRMDVFPLWFHMSPTWKHFSYLFTDTNYAARGGAGRLRPGPAPDSRVREPRHRGVHDLLGSGDHPLSPALEGGVDA